MFMACETCGRPLMVDMVEPEFGGVRLLPSPDSLTRLLMQADRVVETEFAALVRKIATALESRPNSCDRRA